MPTRNFLVIITDQHRYDVNGTYGSQICKTPAIDRLAEQGIKFDNAYSVCALCTPARASMLTGMAPHKHKLIRNSEDPYCKTEFDQNDTLISEYFTRADYVCGLIGKWHCGLTRLPSDFGFEGMDVPGYGVCRETEEYQTYLERKHLTPGKIVPTGSGWQKNIILAGKDTGPLEASVPYFLAEETIRYLRTYQQQQQPFLLFTNFWGPHAPYFPTEPYASMYDPAQIPPWGNFEQDFSDKPQAHKRYRDAFIGEGNAPRSWWECAAWAAAYYGFTTMIDEQIGRIVQEVEHLGLADETVMIFTSDHGDLLGAHGGMHDKCSIMCQETYHIPFIVRVPGMSGGESVSQPITNMDLTPTLLELAGIKPERPLDGRSLVPLLSNPQHADWEPYVVCQFNGHHYHYQSRMITDGHCKLVFNAPEIDEFYDLEVDPWETTNLIDSPQHQELIANMRAALREHLERSGDPLAGWMKNLFVERQKELTPYGEKRYIGNINKENADNVEERKYA